MAHESILHGVIDAGDKKFPRQMTHSLNRQVIESLPSEPAQLIQRQTFAIVEPPVSFRTQLIHFARSFNYIESFWHEFLTEFESLLGRMYWYGVDLHIHFDQYGAEYTYSWLLNDQGFADLHAEPPRPISSWEFSGGPREFPSSR